MPPPPLEMLVLPDTVLFVTVSVPALSMPPPNRSAVLPVNVLLVTVSGDKLGSALRWEPSRGGELFPHVYGAIPMAAVEKVEPLPLGKDGAHQFPF